MNYTRMCNTCLINGYMKYRKLYELKHFYLQINWKTVIQQINDTCTVHVDSTNSLFEKAIVKENF